MEDDENDLIFTSKIRIKDYLKGIKKLVACEITDTPDDEDYTEFIMRVINAAIEVVQDCSNNYRERTNFEKFTEFNENLFWIVQQKEYQNIINAVKEKGENEYKENISLNEKLI